MRYAILITLLLTMLVMAVPAPVQAQTCDGGTSVSKPCHNATPWMFWPPAPKEETPWLFWPPAPLYKQPGMMAETPAPLMLERARYGERSEMKPFSQP